MTLAIEARGLRKAYRTGEAVVHALNGVDLRVDTGEFLAVMGPSGSGKSTLLHVLGALDTADDGEVVLGGRSLRGLSRKELALVRRHEVGFVFQFFNLVPVLTIGENVVLPATLDGSRPDGLDARLNEIFEMLGISEQRDKLPSQVSGGEQQRAAIARALVNEPAVILADEPTGNLDRASGAQVMELLRTLNESGKTVVVVTHDPGVASAARRVVFMRDGRIVDEAALDSGEDKRAVLERLVQFET
jgi:putative ABC transport system ATP-binding protein